MATEVVAEFAFDRSLTVAARKQAEPRASASGSFPIWKFFVPAFLLLSGCGYIGDPLPPALRIPGRVTDLRVAQQEDRIVIHFTVPELTTDGLPLRLGKLDLLAGPYAQAPFNAEAWAAGAKTLDTSAVKPGPATVEVTPSGWNGQEVFFRVRVLSDRGKDGGWSDFANLRVIAPLHKPDGLKVEATAQGVKLTWAGPREPAGMTFRIRRREGKGAVAEVATAAGSEWVDTQTRYGETYEYSVQSLMTADGARAESAQSDPISIVPVDRFPPAVPTGLTALAGPSSIELSWDPNPEPDLAGYIVYRAVSGGALERLAGPLAAPSFSDKGTRPATAYKYAVSAVDQTGNESPRSNAVEISMP